MDADEVFEVARLPDLLVAGAEIENDFCARERQGGAGGIGRPEVFTELDAELHIGKRKDEAGADGDVLAAELEGFALADVGAGGEPALLIEFFVIRQIGLGNKTVELAVLQYCRQVKESPFVGQGDANDGDDFQIAAKLHQAEQRGFCFFQQ